MRRALALAVTVGPGRPKGRDRPPTWSIIGRQVVTQAISAAFQPLPRTLRPPPEWRRPPRTIAALYPPSSGPVVRRQGRRSASGRGLCGRLTGRLSACMVARLYCALRQPPGLAPRSWRPGLWGLGSACPARFCVLGGCLRRGRAARPLLWAVFGPRLWALLACAPSPRRIASRARLARCPPLSALAGAGRLPGPGLLWAPAGGRRYRPPVALWPPWAVPPPGIPSAAPPAVAWGSWCVNRQRLRGAQRLALARSRAPRCGQKVL